MKYFFALILLMPLMGCIGASVNSPITFQDENGAIFPIFKGIDRHGKPHTVPEVFASDFNLITLAFEPTHQGDVDTWIDNLKSLRQHLPTLEFYQIPVISNGQQSGFEDENLRERIITLYTDKALFINHMHMIDDRIYTLLLDKNANIIWRAEGPVNDKTLDDLTQLLDLLDDPLRTL